MSDKIRFGLIGCGGFGRSFAQHVLEVGDIVALCDRDAALAEAAATEHGLKVPRYDDHRRMLNEQKLDAVVITAANFAHTELATAAADAGCHVYCEKAMARTVPECWEMVRACQQHQVKLMIGHKRRLRPPWARLIELTDETLLGPALAVSVTQYADIRPYNFFDTWWADPQLGGGFLHLHGVHVVEWFRALCGNAVRVSALCGPQHDKRYHYPDIVHATFQFESGALATITGGLSFPLHQFRESQVPWAECRHGGFKLVPFMDHIDLYWQRLDEEQLHHERFDDLGFDHAFRLEVGDFVRWVQEDRTPCLTWVEGLRCVELMEAAYRSAARGGEMTELPLYPELEEGD